MCLILLALTLGHSLSEACFCEKYPWGQWSACSRTCNYGTHTRQRKVVWDKYYWDHSCQHLCVLTESGACNQRRCPINCELSDYSAWSECSPCAKKQLRTRSVRIPAQFGGSPCSEEMMEERPCHPAKECKLPPISCKTKFKCNNGRCISPTLKCNRQDDCGDNSDERDCSSFTTVCPHQNLKLVPGSDLIANGWDALNEMPRGSVLDNTFMGPQCELRRPPETLLYHRMSHNFKSFEILAGREQDFEANAQPLKIESYDFKSPTSSNTLSSQNSDFLFFPIFYFGGSSSSSSTSKRQAFESSKTKSSRFFRVHQILKVANFSLREGSDLVLSQPFLQFLHALPLQYNYPLYRDIFVRFGTHYFDSGVVGGHYDLVYQFSEETLKASGESEETFKGCVGEETFFTVILYTQYSSVTRCRDEKTTETSRGSYIQRSEKSFSMVRGGHLREAACLAWEKGQVPPNKQLYRDWARTVLEKNDVVDYKLRPLVELVHGLPCAVTKRRHLRRALLQYLEEFDPCKCSPCPNNGRAVLDGSRCVCLCQTGTYGDNCELRAPGFTSEAVDGSWSCWGSWSNCGASMSRQRFRRCNNPSPAMGGQPCPGPRFQNEPCFISLFEKVETCDDDDADTQGWIDELPPGFTGCRRPPRPDHGFLRKSKQYYEPGEDEEFICFTGFELEGYQFFNCRPDGTWGQLLGRCVRRMCFPPDVPEDMVLFPNKELYTVGEPVGLNCLSPGLSPLPRGFYRCSPSLSWEPALPSDLRCTNESPLVPESRCGPGQRLQDSECVCRERQSCMKYEPSLCVLNTLVNASVHMSLCAFTTGRCHGDPLFYIADGQCEDLDQDKLDWSRFRAKMASKSSVHRSCDLDTCYDWEKCSASKRCECRSLGECSRDMASVFCVTITMIQMTRSLSLCALGAMRCAGHQLEIVNEGKCAM